MPHAGVGSLAHAGGFTFIELMIVLLIMVVAAGVVVPSFVTSGPQMAIRSAARTVLALAQRARSEAVARAVRFRITLDLEERLVLITAELDPLGAPGDFVDVPEPWAREIELDPRVRVEGVTTTEDDQTQTISTGECELELRPDGTATEAEITLAADDDSRQIILIHGLTGRAEIAEEPLR